MNEMKIFENAEFGKVRTMIIEGEPWFVGKDVAEILGYSNPRKAILDHVDDDDKTDGVTIRDSIGRNQNPVFINESGLYSLILSSKLPTAKKFKKWVTNEVLPTIRKTGGYVSNTDMFVEAYFSEMPDEMKIVVKGILDNSQKLKEKNAVLTKQVDVFTTETLEWADRNIINAMIRRYGARALDNNFGQAWVNFKKELLYKYSININSRVTKQLNDSGKKPKTLDVIDDEELIYALKPIVAMCNETNVDIDDLLKNKGEIKTA